MCLMTKEVRINVRTTEQIKRDLEITARLRGITVSALVNSQVVKAIREEKEREPQAFNLPDLSHHLNVKNPEAITGEQVFKVEGFEFDVADIKKNVTEIIDKKPRKAG
jgi:post-segregation antitoxin (ccd killing protein)